MQRKTLLATITSDNIFHSYCPAYLHTHVDGWSLTGILLQSEKLGGGSSDFVL